MINKIFVCVNWAQDDKWGEFDFCSAMPSAEPSSLPPPPPSDSEEEEEEEEEDEQPDSQQQQQQSSDSGDAEGGGTANGDGAGPSTTLKLQEGDEELFEGRHVLGV